MRIQKITQIGANTIRIQAELDEFYNNCEFKIGMNYPLYKIEPIVYETDDSYVFIINFDKKIDIKKLSDWQVYISNTYPCFCCEPIGNK